MVVVNSIGELRKVIRQRIEEQGLNCNLNDIDVSRVDDMSSLFTWIKTLEQANAMKLLSECGCAGCMSRGT